MQYFEKIPAAIFAIVVLFLALKALKNALQFTDSGIFNFVVILILVALTVPPCRPYTEKAFRWGWSRLPAAVTQKKATFRLFESTVNRFTLPTKVRLEKKIAGAKKDTDWLLSQAVYLVLVFIVLVITIVFSIFYGIYHYVILAGCALLWRLYLFPPVLGFFAYDIMHWTVNAPIIGVPAAFIFTPFDAVFTRLRRKKMDLKLAKLRGEIINKLDAIDRAQGMSIAINTSELNQVLNSSTLLTKWFRGWRTRVSSTLNQRAMDSLTQTVNSYTKLLESYELLGMQQHSLSTMGARQELNEQELLAREQAIRAEIAKYKKEQAVAELARKDAEVEITKIETQLEKMRKKHNV